MCCRCLTRGFSVQLTRQGVRDILLDGSALPSCVPVAHQSDPTQGCDGQNNAEHRLAEPADTPDGLLSGPPMYPRVGRDQEKCKSIYRGVQGDHSDCRWATAQRSRSTGALAARSSNENRPIEPVPPPAAFGQNCVLIAIERSAVLARALPETCRSPMTTR